MINHEITDSIIDILKQLGIKKIINNNKNVDFLDKDFDIYYVEDARTAGYIATGMSIEAKEPIFVVVDSDNSYRSLAPAITEAYYRNIPILVGVFKSSYFSLDFSLDFNDTFKTIEYYNNVENSKKIINAFIKKDSVPGLIIFDFYHSHKSRQLVNIYKEYLACFDENDFVLISNNINYVPDINSKIYINNGAYGLDGVLSITLGASFSKKFNKYCCLVLEQELLHDLNTLGNRHFPNNITIFVISKHDEHKKTIKDFSKSLDIELYDYPNFEHNYNRSSIVWIKEE